MFPKEIKPTVIKKRRLCFIFEKKQTAMDKELALIISEMLIKQDETTSQIKETNSHVKETNNILRDFMELSVKHWEQQQTFNEILANELRNIKDVLSTLAQ